MSAAVLREAAALIRERAQAATPGPWLGDPVDGDVWGPGNRDPICRTSSYAYSADATHVASWHPTVALAVADWLDDVAIMGRCDDCSYSDETCSLAKATGSIACCPDCQHPSRRALTVALAYLGREA